MLRIDSAFATRLIELIGTRVAVPISPDPCEAIADFAFRVACVNGYPTVQGMLDKRCLAFNHYTFATGKSKHIGLADILALRGENELDRLLYKRSPGKVAVDFFGAVISPKLLVARRRVAPSSLRSKLVSKAIWHVKALSFDPVSLERLIDSCPVCQTELNFRNSLGIHRCHLCGPRVDLREFPQPRMETTDVEGLSFLTGLIDPERPGGKAAVADLHNDLRQENPGSLFSFCFVLASLLGNSGAARPNSLLSAPVVDVSPDNLAAAGKAILTWPHGAVDLITRIDDVNDCSRLQNRTVVQSCLGIRAIGKSLVLSARKLSTLHRLQAASQAKSEKKRDNADLARQFSIARRSRLFERATRPRSIPPLSLFNSFLLGYFGAPEDPYNAVEKGIEDWVSEVFSNVKPSEEPSDSVGIPLQNFVRTFYDRDGDPWPEILDAIRRSHLPVKAMPGCGLLGVDRLFVTDYPEWRRYLKTVGGVATTVDFPLWCREAAFYLGLSPPVARPIFDWRTPVTLRHVRYLSARYITIGEISDLLRVSGEVREFSAIRSHLDKAGVASYRMTLRNRADALGCLGL
ncbi:hypothetical protein ELH80_13775 [Rhizobium ruizarguesonis]|uniref:hypothetical protein n=1 Tax=Rhizobium ruizarguesonis TaxID=2081791 RepID=UPI0010318F69|nr:hypothetical protein [Rhizobium ruizarguesonis]TAZ35364.1 hypothetical protein ELH80_13775 [Rhizobium ruizarguesonis]